MRRFSLLCFLLFSFFSVQSQNLKCRWISTGSPIQLDSAVIEPGSIFVSDTSAYEYNEVSKMIEVTGSDSVLVCYRILPVELFPDFINRPIEMYEPSDLPTFRPSDAEENQLFNFGSGVQKSGFISRGITVGNRQSLFVNSTLNLQIHGEISENLNLEAVITDQNIPFQPEGNTQQIRDFDNIYLRIYNNNLSLTAGDIVYQNPFEEAYFLKYYKNVQGIQFRYQSRAGKWKSYTEAGTSASKGKFASVEVKTIEGSQGPYHLRGPNNEQFVIVLANSERVFLDGQRLDRGFDRDYVIDYNLGQITFNASVLITEFSVVRVDYEYAEQLYARTSSSLAQSLENEQTKFTFNYYVERDNNSSSLGFQPSAADLETLRSIGDELNQAKVQGADSVTFSLDQILYERRDTTDIDGQPAEVFVHSYNPDAAYYRVSFTQVGFGGGDYVLKETTTNGRVFQWVSPQGGVSQGNYDPTRQVSLPQSKRMATMSLAHKFSIYEHVSTEIAMSGVDRNLYSALDDNDNDGLAWTTTLTSSGRKIFGNYRVNTQLMWEWDDANFLPIDRYRPILFDRDWDYNPEGNESIEDLIIRTKLEVLNQNLQGIKYQVMHRKRAEAVDGFQHQAELNHTLGNWTINSQIFGLKNDRDSLRSDWIRMDHQAAFRKWMMVPGFRFSMDQNSLSLSDSIVSSQMHFVSNEFFLVNSDSSRARYRLSFQERRDQSPILGEMEPYVRSQNYRWSYGRNWDLHQLEIGGTYRALEYKQTGLRDEWLNARLIWDGKFFNENLSHELGYQVGNVRELKRDFIYVMVGGNQGTHAWRDENEDGIKDLNEFYEAINIDERVYAKFFTPTDEFVTAFETRYQHRFEGRLPRAWSDQGGLKGFASKWAAEANFDMHSKTTSRDVADRLNPVSGDPANDEIIFMNNRVRYALHYNRNGRRLGWEGSMTKSSRKQLLSNGYEYNYIKQSSSAVRWRTADDLQVIFNNDWMLHENRSDFLTNRNADIRGFGLGPELIWQPSVAMRVSAGYMHKKRENRISENPGRSGLNEVFGGLTWNKSGAGSLNALVRWIKIDYEGVENNYVSYQLLDALRPGQNMTWRVNWQQQLGKGIQMTLQYNGRSSEAISPVHTGTLLMTAFF